MKNNTKRILKYVLEFLIVAFGVFLGIYVNDWQNQKKINIEKEKTIQYIIEELEANQANLIKTIQYHETIKNGFDSLRTKLGEEVLFQPYFTNKKFNYQDIPGWTGIGLPNFENIAFEGAKMNGIIREIDIESIQIISKAYKLQNFIDEIGKETLNRMIGLNLSSKTFDVILILELVTSDFLNSERMLYNQYTQTIKQLKQEVLTH